VATNDELTSFVRDALGRGLSRARIEEALRQAGWGPEPIGSALSAFAPVDFPIPVPRPRVSLSAREAFLYLLQFSTLYTVAYNLGSLLFQFVNRALPDPADGPYTSTGAAIRWSVSALIVAFPVFMFVSSVNSRTVRANPAIRASPVRRWLTYVTLFGAACTLIGDVMSLVYNALGGELTPRFVLKVVIVGAIAGTTFWYYLSDLRMDEQDDTP
jgi:hypothetical protein